MITPIRICTVPKNYLEIGYCATCDRCGMYIKHYIKISDVIYGLNCAYILGFISEERLFSKR